MCSVSLVAVAAFVLGRLCTGAGVRSARVSLSVGGPPMSVTVAGSVTCAIVLMRWVRRLELHCIVDVSGRTMWGMCCMMARRMCVPHSVPPGCCSVLAWMVRQEFYSVTLAFRQTTGNKADGISEMAYQHCTVVNCSA